MYSEDVSLIVDSSPPFDAGHDDVDVIIDEIDADESFDASSPILEAGASANSYNTNDDRYQGATYKSFNSTIVGASSVCCGLCGVVLPYNELLNSHLPQFHAEVCAEGTVELEEIPYDSWLQEQQQLSIINKKRKNISKVILKAKGSMQESDVSTFGRRMTSKHRVRTSLMTIKELEDKLSLKMIEKLGREVPVTLVDKLHARCGICKAIVSLNKKFETVHLVRHFNAWHASSHECAGKWPPNSKSTKLPLSDQDFAIVGINLAFPKTIQFQCIWCAAFMDRKTLALHFKKAHANNIEVPRCNLCMQELILNACLFEKFGENCAVKLIDENSIQCDKFPDQIFKREEELLRKMEQSMFDDNNDANDLYEPPLETLCSNSRMKLGRNSRPKRQFIMPMLRQAKPNDSKYIDPVSLYHWQCKLCGDNIMSAVISAMAIRHFSKQHKEDLDGLKQEIMLARLDRLSNHKMTLSDNPSPDGKMQIYCQICKNNVPLQDSYNISRAIRHLKTKHPDVMPEHGGEKTIDCQDNDLELEEGVVYAEEIADVKLMESLRDEFHVDFDKAFSIYGTEIKNQIYVLCRSGDEIDTQTVEEIARLGEKEPPDKPFVVQLPNVMSKNISNQP